MKKKRKLKGWLIGGIIGFIIGFVSLLIISVLPFCLGKEGGVCSLPPSHPEYKAAHSFGLSCMTLAGSVNCDFFYYVLNPFSYILAIPLSLLGTFIGYIIAKKK